jgi:hypothetical protein
MEILTIAFIHDSMYHHRVNFSVQIKAELQRRKENTEWLSNHQEVLPSSLYLKLAITQTV